MHRTRSFLVFIVGSLLLAPAIRGADEVKRSAPIAFNRDIRPILSDNCFQCHGPDKSKRKAELRLDTEAGSHVVAPGKPDESELYRRVTASDESERMPPAKSGRKLTPAQIELLRRWVAEGARWESHWAYGPPARPALSLPRNAEWLRNPIDAFILSRLEREGLTPSPEAARSTLIRRVTLDLTGLPPTLDEVDAFLSDRSPDAYDKVVDRLLASPRYGERMAYDWLDAARYADTNGYQGDSTRTMWPWRDWAIEAFNRNMPFDRFTIEQIAGDLLPNATVSDKIASGFHRNLPLNGEGGRIEEESRVDYVVDRVDTTAIVWLGLTLGCARCHDHKFDPFLQKDYYQVFAYFNNVAESGGVDRGGNAAPIMRLPTPEQSAKLAKLDPEVAELDKALKADAATIGPTVDDGQRSALAALLSTAPPAGILRLAERVVFPAPSRRKLLELYSAKRKERDDINKAVIETMVMEERPKPRETHILIRGAYDKFGEKVNPGVPTVLSISRGLPKTAATNEDMPPNRLGLARWLVNPANPLTARVTVNRYWQKFFGIGLVKTTEDFGVQGEAPSHPELLDWLATEFVRSGWDVKALHRLIVTSATYRQSSRLTPEMRECDPDNRLLARGPRYRLSSHALRDQALAISGLLAEKLGGPPVKPYQPPGIWEEMSFGFKKYDQDHGPNLYRRSLYTFWRRIVGPPNLFDASMRQVCAVRQVRTNTPLHALTLMNDPTYVEAARVLAERVMTHAQTAEDRLALAFRLTTSRTADEREQQVLLQSFRRLLAQYQANREAATKLVSTGEWPRNPALDVAELAAYTGVANLLLNLDEVINKE